MTTASPQSAVAASRLQHVPIGLFAMVLGIAGLGLAWRKAHETIGLTALPATVILGLAGALFAGSAILYGAKLARFPLLVKGEIDHPVKGSFFATVSASMVLLGTAAYPAFPGPGFALWAAGAALHLVLTLRIVGRWISHKHDIAHINPAWFIPAVGNIIVPLLGVKLGLHDVSWFFFSIGIVFWVALFVIVLYRLIFHDDLPPKLMPTLVILIAPPAVGYLSYVGLNGGAADNFARILIHLALFTTLLLASLAPRLARLPFAMSWWAFTFPLDAVSIAALDYGAANPGTIAAFVAPGLLAVSSAAVAVILARTVRAHAAESLFVPD